MTRVLCCVPGCTGSREGDPQWTRVMCGGCWRGLDAAKRDAYKQAQWAVMKAIKSGASTPEIRAACVPMAEAWKLCVADAERTKIPA